MCQYWKKLHTCSHLSDRPYIEMCRSGYLSNTVCFSIDENPTPRPSHFPCYPCIKHSAYTETIEKRAQIQTLVAAATNAQGAAAREKMESEKRAKEERVRKEAKEKAERERVREQKARLEKEKEAEKAKKEGGPWVLAEAGSGKKKKGKTMSVSPASPSSPSNFTGAAKKDMWKENAKTVWKGSEKGADPSGRAGTWGPKRILSRKDGAAGVLSTRTDGPKDVNEVKK